MALKIFRPNPNAISVFNAKGINIDKIQNIKDTDGIIVIYKNGFKEIFENYKILIDNTTQNFDPTQFESVEAIDIINDPNNLVNGDIVYYLQDFYYVNDDLKEILNVDILNDGSGLSYIQDNFTELFVTDFDVSLFDQFTMSFWVRKDSDEIFNTNSLKIFSGADNFQFDFEVDLDDYDWHFVSITVDKNSGSNNLYLDNNLVVQNDNFVDITEINSVVDQSNSIYYKDLRLFNKLIDTDEMDIVKNNEYKIMKVIEI